MEKNNDNKEQINKVEFDNIETIKTSKKIDIFTHLKLGIQNARKNCGCVHDTTKESNDYYCIPCKLSCCPKCSLCQHQKHLLIKKSKYKINKNNINAVFEPIDYILENNSLFTDSSLEKNQLLKEVEETYNKLKEVLKEWKEFKEQEIANLFESLNKQIEEVNKKKAEAKKTLMDFINTNKNFLNTNSKNKNYNRDMNNTLFLISYDLLNISNDWSNELKATSKNIEKDIFDYESNEKKKNEVLIQRVKTLLSKDNNDKINLNIESDNFFDPEIDERLLPYNQANKEISNFNPSSLKDIEKRIYRYDKLFDALRNKAFSSYLKHGDFSEIQKENTLIESTKTKGVDNLFSQRKATNSGNKTAEETTALPIKALLSKNDVILDNPILIRYFGHLMSDLYDNYFKMMTKELQSSHADLKIKISEEDEADVAKVIEGTNQIYIYDKKSQKMIRKNLKLTKNPFGYTKFPYGCRSILIGDKFYITGGKTESQEFPNVIIYDRKTDNLKRIMDMNYPRSYHSLIFNDIFETIMVIGGEYCNTVEIFDPLTNRWQMLPPLNVPRCNPLFFFDEPRGNMYVLFGIEGNYVNGNYIDSMEILDLTNIKAGWEKLNYQNRANMDLKCYLNIYKLNEELFLIYGGMEGRVSKRNVCLYNTVKNEVTKIGKELMEQIRKEAKNSRKLSSIVTTISKESIV
jgi:hypothetical protein